VNAALAKVPGQRPRDAFSFAASLRNLKKALTGPPTEHSTDNRATGAAVVGAESAAPFFRVQQQATDGPYVISPAPHGTPPGAQPVATPFTTAPGMAPPSLGPAFAPGPTATSPQPVDRSAPTNSFVPDVMPSPQQGTNADLGGFGGTLASPAAPPVQPSAFRWPPEQLPARSEEPQVRTLSGVPGVPKHSVAPVLAAVFLMVVLALASVVLVVVRLRSPSPEAAAKRPMVSAATTSTPPLPQPVVVMPAPTLAPPGLDDTPAPSSTPAVSASAASPRPRDSGPPPTSKALVPVVKPLATAAVPARPGPGF
jgi:hypothetical protein